MLFPAMLALSDETAVSGHDFIRAYLLGTEVSFKAASFMIPGMNFRGFHITPVFGVIGAAAACAWLLKLGEAEFVSEQQMKEAMYAADKAICKQCEAQIELAKKAGRPKKEYKLYPVPEALKKALETFCADRIEGVCTIPGKEDRMNAMDALRDDARKALLRIRRQ